MIEFVARLIRFSTRIASQRVRDASRLFSDLLTCPLRRNIMQFFFRRPGTMIPVILVSTLLATGCAKQPPASESGFPPPAAQERESDKTVVAKVNGVALYGKELDEIIRRLHAKYSKTVPPVSEEETRKKALDELVIQELAFQDARRQGISVKPRDIDNAITSIVGHNPKDLEDFLARQRVSEDQLRAKIERTIRIHLIFGQEVLQKAKVSDDDVRKEYESQKGQYVAPEKITVVDVFVPAKQDVASPQKLDYDAALKKASELLASLKMHKDTNPSMLSRDDSFSVESRDLDKGKEPELYEAVRKLSEGEYTRVIPVPDGARFLQLTKIVPEHQMSYEEVKDGLTGNLKRVAQMKRLQEWEQELKKDAKIELLDDPGIVKSKKP